MVKRLFLKNSSKVNLMENLLEGTANNWRGEKVI